ncbi:MAG: fumarylacetoacetate hydrolase family protein [Chloroflexi bacterium]|nr:fumarylacetoacetate hydrolase family protein [Chloroflexota bacterium]
MKLVTYDDFKPGLLVGDRVVDITPALGGLGPLDWDEAIPAIIANYQKLQPELERLSRSGGDVPLASVRLRAPNPRPAKILCAVANYLELGARPKPPIDFFFKSPEGVIGDSDTVVLPRAEASIFHHEAELAVVIGKECRKVSAAQAMDYVFGYTAFIDVSGRNLGRVQASTFFGKSFDTFAPMGPCIATADEIPDPHKLQVRLWVDGQLRQDYNTDDMGNPIPDLIEWASGYMTLNPGDMIATGTNHQGLGALQDGDRVEMEIERIGRFTVRVQDPLKRSWPKGVDEALAARMRGETQPAR